MSKKIILSFVASAFLVAMSAVTPTFASPDLSNVVTAAYDGNTKSVKTKTSANKKAKVKSHTTTKIAVSGGKHNAGPKPGKWCGWYMRTIFGGGPEYNLARNWAKRGVSAGGPRVGAVVVWRGHVGLITGRTASGQWLVHSGNTAGGRIATKPRSVSGAIAFRLV